MNVTIHLMVSGANRASNWYQEVFGAVERSRVALPDGRLIHVEMDFGAFSLMLADEFPEQGAVAPQVDQVLPSAFYVHVDDVESLWTLAVGRGATVLRPLTDVFWGEREGQFRDPFGYRWGVTQHLFDVSQADLVAGVAAMFSANREAS